MLRVRGSGSFRYVDISSIDNQTKAIAEPAIVPNTDAPSRARQVIAANDVLVSTVRPTLNAVALVPPELDSEICSTGFCVLRPDERLIAPEYLFAWVRTSAFVQMLARLERGLSYPAVTDGDVKSRPIPLPPLPEQRRIAAILRQADVLRRLRGAANNRTGHLLAVLFAQMFNHEQAVAQRWPARRLSDLGEISYGLTVNAMRRNSSTSYPYLRVANVYRWRLDLSEIATIGTIEGDLDKYALRAGDVLVVEGHGDPRELGRAAVWRDELPLCLHQNHLLRIRPNPDLATPNFLAGHINSQAGLSYMLRYGKTSSGLNTINSKVLGDMPIVYAPLTYQQEFERRYAAYRHLVSGQNNTRVRLAALNDSISAEAFTGELTASWREKHATEVHDAAVQRDIILGLRRKEPRLGDFELGRVTQAEREAFGRRLREAIAPAVQQLVKAPPIPEILFPNLGRGAFDEFTRIAEQARQANKEIVDTAIFREVRLLPDVTQQALKLIQPQLTEVQDTFRRLAESMTQQQQQIRAAALTFAEQMSRMAALILERPGESHPRHYLLKALSDDQYLVYLAATEAEKPFTPSMLSQENDLTPPMVERHLETLASLGLVAKISVEVSPTPEATYYISAFRRPGDRDDSRSEDLALLKAGPR